MFCLNFQVFTIRTTSLVNEDEYTKYAFHANTEYDRVVESTFTVLIVTTLRYLYCTFYSNTCTLKIKSKVADLDNQLIKYDACYRLNYPTVYKILKLAPSPP